ncbi:glycosyltransferase family 61 protein [bacterium]|nr:glycosyltransferase family 61 protein [bacterium]
MDEKATDQQQNFVRNLVSIKKGRINLNPWSFITKDDKLLFKESSCYGPIPEDHWVFRSIKLPKIHELKGKTLFLSSRSNYWHLLADELCDLSLLINSRIKINEFDHIIFEKSPFSAGKELQEIFGLHQLNQVSLQELLHIECEELFFFTGTFCLSKHALSLVQYKIKSSLIQSSSNSGGNSNRIIVSRGSSTTRRWLNENDCKESLNTLGFELIDPSKLSLSEQVKAFSSAEIILGPHGAGLTNIMFCNPGTKVIEIRSQEQGGEYSSANCYEELSRIFRVKHHTFDCPSTERKDLKGRSIEDADLVPDPIKLMNFICEKVLI